MGVLNVTPDSFSDGGRFLDPSIALEHAIRMCEEGADIIDIGAESSRPGADFVSLQEEWQRLEPILTRLKKQNLTAALSVDTNKPELMVRLADYGVSIVNDIKGGADAKTLKYLADQGMTYCAMHMHQTPDSMQQQPLSGDEAVNAVADFYEKTYQRLQEAGFSKEKIWLDPGIGFGKDDSANLKLIKQAMQQPEDRRILLGISRKSFLGRLLGLDDPLDRDPPSKILEACFFMMGVHCVRTHDISSLYKMRQLLES